MSGDRTANGRSEGCLIVLVLLLAFWLGFFAFLLPWVD